MIDDPSRKRTRRNEPSTPARSLGSILEQVAAEKGIAKEVLVADFEAATLEAARRVLGPARKLEARFPDENGEIELHQFVTIVEVRDDPEREVGVEAVEKNGELGEATPGDELGFQIFFLPEDAPAAREHDRAYGDVMPRVTDADRARIHQEYESRKAALLHR